VPLIEGTDTWFMLVATRGLMKALQQMIIALLTSMLIAHCSSSYVVGHSLLPRWRHIMTLAVLSASERSTKLSLGTKIDLMPRLNGPEILRRRTKLRNFAHSLAFQLIAFISVTSKLADHVDFPEASRVSIAPGPSWLQNRNYMFD
jgi:hypothetical protein